MTVLEMCEGYYPRLWGVERLRALVRAGRLAKKEFEALTGEAYGDGE